MHSSRAKKKRGKRNIRFSGQMSLSVQEMLKMYLNIQFFRNGMVRPIYKLKIS